MFTVGALNVFFLNLEKCNVQLISYLYMHEFFCPCCFLNLIHLLEYPTVHRHDTGSVARQELLLTLEEERLLRYFYSCF